MPMTYKKPWAWFTEILSLSIPVYLVMCVLCQLSWKSKPSNFT